MKSKNDINQTLTRLIRLDAALASDGITVKGFAEAEGVQTLTVRRDLNLLRSLGCPVPLAASWGSSPTRSNSQRPKLRKLVLGGGLEFPGRVEDAFRIFSRNWLIVVASPPLAIKRF